MSSRERRARIMPRIRLLSLGTFFGFWVRSTVLAAISFHSCVFLEPPERRPRPRKKGNGKRDHFAS
jgi:hypothetical protein